MKGIFCLIAIGLWLLFSNLDWIREPVSGADLPPEDWPVYGGNPAGNRYSTLTQINRQNVKNLQLAWTFDTGENNDSTKRGMDIQCQPIVIDGVLYGTTPRHKLFAVDAATGQQLWKFDPFADPKKQPRFHPLRGVTFWTDGRDKRILYSSGASLYAINANTGELIRSFGTDGEVDLHEGLGDKETLGHDVSNLAIRNTTPGVIYQDLIIVGSSMSEGGDAPPGNIRAFNVRTGKLAWTFHTIPLPGEYGYDTWSKDSYKKIGGANCWAGMVVDEKRGIVYAGTGSPTVDFYGGDRAGKNLFANCVLALNAKTGQRIWHFQTVHHDLWDRDLPCPPNLLTVTQNGPDGRSRQIDAVAQATKDGYVFVFDRETGRPLFPVKEVAVPTVSALPGEKPWPTQPVPKKPAPFALQQLTEENITNRSPEARAYVLERFRNSKQGNKYLPPNEEGTLIFGMGGGAEWGGTAADPNGIFYVNGNNMLWWLKMRSTKTQPGGVALTQGARLFNANCSVCHAISGKQNAVAKSNQAYPDLTNVGKRLDRTQINALLATGRGRMPSFSHIAKEDREAIVNFLLHTEPQPVTARATPNDIHQSTNAVATAPKADFPYVPPYLNNGNTQFRDQDGYPAIKPPWGTLNAIDLNTGEYKWQIPLGEYPELARKGLTQTGSIQTGTENHGGPVVTAGGLVFIAATYDEKLRAFDKQTGKLLWEYKLPAGGFATPITYSVGGRQYVAIAAGGNRYGLKAGGSYVAFALPTSSK